MPSISHEASIELIRQHPMLAVELLGAVPGIEVPGEPAAVLGSADMSGVTPAQYLADMVVVIADATTGKPALAVIIEPQSRDDKTKQISWPVYVTTARKANSCRAALLMVICADPAEAAKCRQLIRTGHPGFDLVPVVIDPYTIPSPPDSSPWLVIFSGCIGAIDMENERGCRQVLTAIRETSASTANIRSLTTIIMAVASAAARQILEDLMATTQFKSDFIDGLIEQGLEQGLTRGAAQAKAEDILKVLQARGLLTTSEQREQVTSCTDLGQLGKWFDRALTAPSTADVFAG
jgi:hypothetical protein